MIVEEVRKFSSAGSVSLDIARECLSVALICDALDASGFRHQSPRLPFRNQTANVSATNGSMMIGYCKTTLWADMAFSDPQPYELELKAIDSCEREDVIVCSAAGSLRSGIWGELLSTAARNQGCVGVLVDGAVRDIAKMRSMAFTAYSLGVSPYDSKDRQRVIDFDVTIEIGGVTVSPGDLVAADEDGVVFVPKSVVHDVLSAAWAKAHDENKVRDAIRSGMSAQQAYAKFGIL